MIQHFIMTIRRLKVFIIDENYHIYISKVGDPSLG